MAKPTKPKPPQKAMRSEVTQQKSTGCVDYFNIRIMPHGGIILVPVILTTMAWLASISTNGCDYSRLTGPGVEILTRSSVVPYVDLGMDAYRIPEFYPMTNEWQVAVNSDCASYRFPVEDSSWIAGKRFTFLSLWCGGAAMMLLWVGTFLILTPRQWKTAGIGLSFACFFQVLSFAWFSTALCHTESTNIEDFQSGTGGEVGAEEGVSSSCSLLYGSRCSIASLFLYLVASLFILLGEYPTPEPKLVVEENYRMLRTAP